MGEERDTTVVIAVTNCQGPQNDGNFLNTRGTISFLIRILLHGVSRLCFICHVRSNYVRNIAEVMAATDFQNREKEVKMDKEKYSLMWERQKNYVVRTEKVSIR